MIGWRGWGEEEKNNLLLLSKFPGMNAVNKQFRVAFGEPRQGTEGV